MDPIVLQLQSESGMERSNRPKAKIVLQSSLMVKVEGLQAATGAVWGRSKISTGGCSIENRPTHGVQLQIKTYYQILSPFSNSSWSLP